MSLVQIEQHGDGICLAANVIRALCDEGKTGRFLHMMENHYPQWEVLVAIEDALIEAGKNKGWDFVVGRIVDDEETEGWLECDGWALVPYGPTRYEQTGSDAGVWRIEEMPENEVWALTHAAPESGIILNAILKQNFYIDESLGS